ncbi:hypothetical protein PPHE_b0176 [Pseudoalteromonas phenolica O-BC30]|nr:hypothetical protein [Pseudoalteromonas phenolica O-BC30]
MDVHQHFSQNFLASRHLWRHFKLAFNFTSCRVGDGNQRAAESFNLK